MSFLERLILQTTQSTAITRIEEVQTLWSGYGAIKRYHLAGGKYKSVIVKHIQLPEANKHPKGWNTDISHQRKLKSYQVETAWYQHYARLTNEDCKVPQLLHAEASGNERLLMMEDLNALGFTARQTPETVSIADAKNCLSWLAHFHANFMHTTPKDLWEIGTYWHLDTRPDELAKMQNIPLQQAATAIDQKLNSANYQTLIHGDAKLANFCFGEPHQVSAVDFQYVGKGCGMKDVAYFISSCFDEDECEQYEEELLTHYFSTLEAALEKSSHAIDFLSLKQEWSHLYKYAWADFYRFLDGWSPSHWKMHGYSEGLVKEVLKELN